MPLNFLQPAWFDRPAPEVAPDLIGCTLCREINGETVRGQIVETEAYEAGDPAMHAYQRKTERNEVVFGPAGILYIYRIYRQYHCFNIVTDRDGLASTILIRAVQLDHRPGWLPIPEKKTRANSLERLAAGPGKLCIALALDTQLKGLAAHPDAGVWVEPRNSSDSIPEITQTTRIGLSKGTDIPWRWYASGSPAVSKK